MEYTFFILCVTVLFREVHNNSFGVDLVPFAKYSKFFECTGEVGREIVTNIIMFIPTGILTCLASKKKRLRVVLIVALSISCAVEISQLLFKCGWCETNDVIHNVFGAYIGYLLYYLSSKVYKSMTL